jgi:HEAT repeat protein
MTVRLAILLLIFGLSRAVVASAAPETVDRQPMAAGDRVLYLTLDASTWRPRGRISFGIAPTVRLKLASAGLSVTEDPATPHNATLKIDYREERGKQISINLYGTDITCLVRLDGPQDKETLDLVIHESPSYTDLTDAPYVEVVEKLQANPYFYFLGEIVRERMQTHIDTTGALILALDRQFDRELHPQPATPLDTLVSPAETFPDLDVHYAAAAQQNTVDELGRLKDSRAVDLLTRLTAHANRLTRLRAVVALGQFDDPSIPPVMTRVAEVDSDAAVRDAAANVLSKRSAH